MLCLEMKNDKHGSFFIDTSPSKWRGMQSMLGLLLPLLIVHCYWVKLERCMSKWVINSVNLVEILDHGATENTKKIFCQTISNSVV